MIYKPPAVTENFNPVLLSARNFFNNSYDTNVHNTFHAKIFTKIE